MSSDNQQGGGFYANDGDYIRAVLKECQVSAVKAKAAADESKA
jgi:hypothetical protein